MPKLHLSLLGTWLLTCKRSNMRGEGPIYTGKIHTQLAVLEALVPVLVRAKVRKCAAAMGSLFTRSFGKAQLRESSLVMGAEALLPPLMEPESAPVLVYEAVFAEPPPLIRWRPAKRS